MLRLTSIDLNKSKIDTLAIAVCEDVDIHDDPIIAAVIRRALKLKEFNCDQCSGKEFEKFEQHTKLLKVFKFSKSEIFFLDKQVTRLHADGKVEDRILDVCLNIRELMKEIPKGLQEVKKTTVKDRK